MHDAIIKRFNDKSIVFDIFAGVGPFVLPAIKLKNAKKCFANDLNPFSIKYLDENIELNKVYILKNVFLMYFYFRYQKIALKLLI